MIGGMTSDTSVLGLIVNPIAGMGGRVALKGTDASVLAEAIRRGATPVAAGRAATALAAFPPGTPVLTAAGAMGADAVRAAGLRPIVVTEIGTTTSAADTMEAATAMARQGAALILFAGGDGTACAVATAVGGAVPVLGIPTGVKMHSGVFAVTPAAAGRLAATFLAAAFLAAEPASRRTHDAEVMDSDEAALRRGAVSARLYGIVRVPHAPHLVPRGKNGGAAPDAAAAAACARVAATLAADTVHLFGPGMTTQRVLARLGIAGTPLGVDAVYNDELLGSDLTEAAILRLIADRPARLVTGVVGGQGFLFGRGNQQISPVVLRRVGRDGITVLADMAKIAALPGGVLHVDTGDAAIDAMLGGFWRVRVGPDQWAVCRVATH
jgi:predicted polyphosphate/ATP-dependent NAD kinase